MFDNMCASSGSSCSLVKGQAKIQEICVADSKICPHKAGADLGEWRGGTRPLLLVPISLFFPYKIVPGIGAPPPFQNPGSAPAHNGIIVLVPWTHF